MSWRLGEETLPVMYRQKADVMVKPIVMGWARARKVGPHFALAGSFNEWSNPNEEPSAEISKDIEPSHVFGMQYLDLLKKEATAFKTGIP
jgi:hypothetical protein